MSPALFPAPHPEEWWRRRRGFTQQEGSITPLPYTWLLPTRHLFQLFLLFLSSSSHLLQPAQLPPFSGWLVEESFTLHRHGGRGDI